MDIEHPLKKKKERKNRESIRNEKNTHTHTGYRYLAVIEVSACSESSFSLLPFSHPIVILVVYLFTFFLPAVEIARSSEWNSKRTKNTEIKTMKKKNAKKNRR